MGPAERITVISAFAAYLVFQLHAVAFHGYWGQDWIDHKNWIAFAAEHPGVFFSHYAEARTNPPLFHLMGAAVKRVFGSANYLPVLGLVNVLLGFAGACFLNGVIRQLVGSPLLRIACIVFILFLPFAMIHAQVIASDALATPLYALLLWLLIRIRNSGSTRAFATTLFLILFVMVLGLQTKFTFGSVVLAVGFWALALWWTRVLSTCRFVAMLAVVVVLPGIVAYQESLKFRAAQTTNWGIRWPARWSEAEMNPRSILWLRAADVDVLSAPAYTWKIDGRYPLLANNEHSFPALLHLGMFTDILNIYQFDPYDHYFGRRTETNHRRMQLAVRTAVVFTAVGAIAVVALFFFAGATVLIQRKPEDLVVLAVLFISLAWFGNIVGAYPLVSGPYAGGYWLPRLLAPALLGFSILGIVFLDRLIVRLRTAAVAVLIAVVGQSAVHASFLWPHQTDEPLYEPNADIARFAEPVLRVASWQDGYHGNHAGEYWLEKRIGIIINRPATDSAPQTWKLTFTIAPGPSNPGPRSVLRISSRHFPGQLISFEGTRQVQLDVPVAGGRNDFALELVSPEALERADDPKVRMAMVSKIELWPPGAASPLRISP